MFAVGIDTGGTFTDLVLYEAGLLTTRKIPSTPQNPADALLAGLQELLDSSRGESSASLMITHGSTVATNALLERKGAKVALVTTAGFEDILDIARQNRPSLYDFNVEKLPPLVARKNIFGVNERVLYDGTVERGPDRSEIEEIAKKILVNGCNSVAVCFLHAYRNPENEHFVADLLASFLNIPVCTSHQVLPAYREYERFSTASVNAFVSPAMDAYIGHIEKQLTGNARLRIMQSNGGSISASRARAEAVQTILSGPAAGVVGALEVAQAAGFERIITFDMGGTSTDVSLCDGSISMRTDSKISGVPIAIPVVDIHTVGAGGGSIAWLDSAGSLHVGPQSAGAEPGPVCYGVGTELTVTDANLFLGRMAASQSLGGRIRLDNERVRKRMSEFAGELGMPAEQAAEGILKVANATMERAIRVISVERGHDPRRFALVAFGGAGPMHACSLARVLGIPNIIIPRNAGVLSALGLLMADVKKDFSQTVLLKAEEIDSARLPALFAPLESEARRVLAEEGFAEAEIVLDRFIDMRYIGQSYEVTIPAAEDFLTDFHKEHFKLYGYSDPARKAELVSIRLSARGVIEPPQLARDKKADSTADAAIAGCQRAVFGFEAGEVRVYERDRLRTGNRIDGPAIVVEANATTVIEPGYKAEVDVFGNMNLKPSVT